MPESTLERLRRLRDADPSCSCGHCPECDALWSALTQGGLDLLLDAVEAATAFHWYGEGTDMDVVNALRALAKE